jgi:hypothetical protein
VTAVTKRVFLQIVLAALLLFGQQVALTHGVSHAHGPAPEHQESGKGSFQSGSCNLHGVYSQILGAMPASPAAHSEQSLLLEQVAAAALPCAAAQALAPLSRGPPALL